MVAQGNNGTMAPSTSSLRNYILHDEHLHDEAFKISDDGSFMTPKLSYGSRIEYTIFATPKCIDSSDMEPEDWETMASIIDDNYLDYDGFVILHGTDTMTFTASGLTFMLQNLSKPVILTGSQIPLSTIPSDGGMNLLKSIMIAGLFDIPEVCIFFGDNLWRGSRATKTSA